jgi:iron complex outermembrane receptor protein
MSITSRTNHTELQPSRLHQAIQHILLASALTVSTAAYAETSTDTASIRHSYHISSGSLGQALRQFATNSGLLYSAEAKLTDGKTTDGLDGENTAEDALKKLLVGTGLTYTFTAEGAVAVRVAETGSNAASTLPAVKVVGKAVYDSTDPYNPDYNRPTASTATKTDTPLIETPYSLRVVPQQIIEDQQGVRLEKALQNVSGVTREPAGNLTVESFNIRGFQSFYTYRDGLRMGLFSPREMANVERVEVLKGPGSILYGRADPGGVVNIVTKQPLANPYYSLQQQFGSYDFYRTAIDATGPISSDKSLRYRLNLSYEDANSFKEFNKNENIFIAPVVTWDITPQTRLGLELEFANIRSPIDIGIPPLNGKPVVLPRERNLGESWAKRNNEQILVGLNWSHDFNDNWTIKQRFNTQLVQEDEVYLGRNGLNPDGTDSRYYGQQTDKMDTYFTNVDLTGKFNTWGASHTLLLGGDYYGQNEVASYADHLDEFLIDIYNPQHLAVPPSLQDGDRGQYGSLTEWYGVYLQDQIKLPFNLHALGGLRYDNATICDNFSPFSSYVDDRVSPRGGLLWRPIPELSFYGSYTENFGATNAFDQDNKPLPPQTAQQWEFGVKTELFDERLTGTLTYFDLTKQNMPTIDRTNPNRSIAIGEVASHGVDVDLAGKILPGWQITGAYAYTPFVEVTKDYAQDDGGNITAGKTGKRNPNVAEHNGNIWTTYEFQNGDLQGFTVGAGASAIGNRKGDFTNTYSMPGYAIANLMAGYKIKMAGSQINLQLNVDNLLDKTYYSGSNGGQVIHYGVPRTFMGLIKVEY